MNQIETIFDQSGMLHDRFISESFELPYSYETIQIQPNELISFRVVNDAVEKLYHNFLYLYGITRVSSNIIPDSLNYVAGVSGTSFEWYLPTTSQSVYQPLSTIGMEQYDIVNNVHAVYSSVYNGYLLFSASETHITVTQTDGTSAINTLLSTFNANIDSDLTFKTITDIKVHGNFLYVIDAFYNNLYRYNITGLLTDDIFPNTLILDKVIGGSGSFQDRYAFNNPTSMCIYNNNIYILDSGNYTVKQYDASLNFVNAYQLKHTLVNTSPKRIISNEVTGEFIIVTGTCHIIKLTSDFKVIEATLIAKNIPDYASIRNVFTSKAFVNFYYIVTSENVYKLYLSKPSHIVGKFTLYRLGYSQDSILCVDSAAVPNTTDDAVFAFTSKNGVTNILNLTETENLISVLSYDDFPVYELQEIKTSGGEYVQPWVFSKAVIKLLLNHLRLKDKIRGRFTGVYDVNQVPLFAGTLYFLLDDLDLTAYQITPDHIIGNNEVLTSAAINRGLKKIYDIQASIIGKSNVIIQDSSYFQNQPVILR